jgi:chemotaxis protein MotB
MSAKPQPIFVIKKKSAHGGHHGGAWKVAYADFVTAMMALFIVLWLMGSSEKVRQAVAGYFNDPKGTANLLGTTMSGNGIQVTETDVNKQRLEALKQKLENEINSKKELQKLAKQIDITITPEGLRIEMLEGKNGTFYQNGSAQLSEHGQELLSLLAAELKTLPNQLLIEGHTDATPYSKGADYSNWELSADRANAARRLLQADGVRSDQVTQVRAYADQLLFDKKNPFDPSNRRITILVKNAPNGAAPKIALPQGFADSHAGANPPAAAAQAKPQSSVARPAAGKPSPASLPSKTSGMSRAAAFLFKRRK